MTDFMILNNALELEQKFAAWNDVPEFDRYGQIVDAKCQPNIAEGTPKYQLIGQKFRNLSCLDRIGRCALGIMIVLCSLGIALCFESVRSLFFQKTITVNFGIPLSSINDQTSEQASSFLDLDIDPQETATVRTPFTLEEQNLLRGAVSRLMANHDFTLKRLEEFTEEEQRELGRAMKSIEEKWQLPSVKELIVYIQKRAEANAQNNPEEHRKRKIAIESLLVILGIKPCRKATHHSEHSSDITKLLCVIAAEIPTLRLDECCTVNERPLALFNPRCYLRNFKSNSLYSRIIQISLATRSDHENQALAYLLGFGPTWECYYCVDPSFNGISSPSPYTDLHYLQLGEVLRSALQEDLPGRADVDLGWEYHHNPLQYHGKYPLKKDLEAYRKDLKAYRDALEAYRSALRPTIASVQALLDATSTGHCYTPISVKTRYSQMCLFLKAHILKKLFSNPRPLS